MQMRGAGRAWVAVLALAKVALLLLATSREYGYFRDELYYLDAAKHLALGYVDYPPLVAFIGAAVSGVLGTSTLALRLLPALAGALVMILAALMARELGAGAFGQALAALACLLSPMLQAIDGFLSPNPFNQLWWALLAFLVIRILRQDRPQLYPLCGAVVGIGVLTKESMLAWSAALVIGLALSPARRHLRTRWFWLGAGVALLVAAPYLYWQSANGWPALEFWNAYRRALVQRSPAGFVLQQIVGMNPATLPLWLGGLYFYLVSDAGRPYRALGWAFMLLLTLFSVMNVKAYFLVPVYPMLFAGGARAIEAVPAGLKRWVRPGYAGLLLATGIFLLPVTLPVLPPASLARVYAPAMASPAIHVEDSQSSTLPEWLAGRLGWQEMVAEVAGVYAALPPAQQREACILAGSYGKAGALNRYGPAYGLPPAISGHNTYYLWGPGNCSGEIIVAAGMERTELEALFGDVHEARHLACADCMVGESEVYVYICQGPRLPIGRLWPELKRYSM